MSNMQKPNFRAGEDENYCCAERVFREERFKETSEDYVLPDYLPDVKKIAGIFPEAVVKGRFMGSGTLEYDGEVRYKILYVSENGLWKSVTFFTVFEDKIGNESFGGDCVESIIPEVRAASVRMINPRKFSVRSQNGAVVTVFRRRSHLPELYGALNGDDENALVCLSEEKNVLNVLTLRESGLSFSEDLNFDSALPTAEEIVFYTAVPEVIDCRLFDGEAQFRGIVHLTMLMASRPSDSGQRETIVLERALSFTQSVKNKALHDGGQAFVFLSPENCEARLREDEFGQKRTVEVDMTYTCFLTAFYPKNVSVVTDAYSTENELDVTAENAVFTSLDGLVKGSFSISESLQTDLPENGGYSLLHAIVLPELHTVYEEGQAVLVGNCGVELLLYNEAGAPDVRRITAPLRFKTEIRSESDVHFGKVGAHAQSVRARLDKNVLSLDAEICFYGCLLSEEQKTAVGAMRILPEKRSLPGKRGSVLLYYPDKNEPSFEIAKRYGVRPEGVEKQLEENAFPVIIFRK